MSKRTNDFQTLIKTIYDQIVPDGGKVTESGMVQDKEAGILREVDILVEYKYAGHEFSFVVECRDRSRAESVEWIDGLIGKTKSLNVNKIIAVSSKGFTASARKKAKENGIETLTLEEANDTHWGEFPVKPGLLVMTDDIYRIHDVFYKSEEEFLPITNLGIDSSVEMKGEIVGNLKGLIEYFFQEHIIPKIDQYKKEHFLEIFKTKDDVKKMLLVESEHTWREINVIDQEGNVVKLSKVKYVIKGIRRTMEVDQEHKVFSNKLVSTGKHLDNNGTTIDFNIVQDPDTRKMHVRWFRSSDEEGA